MKEGGMILSFYSKICNRILWYVRDFTINRKNKSKLKNKSFSLISGDCLGGIVLHDLHLQFNSPTVNCWMYPKDFIKFVNNLKYYVNKQLIFIYEEGINYPIGCLDDIKVYFTHYKSEAHALEKWNKRIKRLNYNNIFVIMTNANNFDASDFIEFNKIKYPHIIFTHKKCNEDNSFYCNHDKNGFFHAWIDKYNPHRYYDSFDFVKWFNSK